MIAGFHLAWSPSGNASRDALPAAQALVPGPEVAAPGFCGSPVGLVHFAHRVAVALVIHAGIGAPLVNIAERLACTAGSTGGAAPAGGTLT